MRKMACIFPGQGSQSAGMGKDLYENEPAAQSVFDDIDRVAGRSLTRLCFEGPDDELKRTVNTQPAILAVSLAAWQAYREQGGPEPDYVAGHSLGEFTALVAAGVLSLTAAVPLVLKRAQLMEECPAGAMSAVIGLSPEILQGLCTEASSASEIVVVANFNTREQLVVSGSPPAVERAGALARSSGGKVIPLPVGGAFHSPLMEAAARSFAQELSRFEFSPARMPVVQNYDALPATSAETIKGKLASQMPSSVRWCESVEFMLGQGVDTFVEIGPGKALAGMVKKIDRSARVYNVYDQESLKSTLAALGEVPVS
ncbi:MAG TPA: ACP S-malonyltransferase [Candidatus Obscuribacterales bacterium]